MPGKRPLLIGALGTLLVLSLLVLLRTPSGPSPLSGLRFTPIDGDRPELTALEGRLVVVNFWATGCPPCIEELPILQALQRDYGDRGVTVIGVAMAYVPPDQVLAFARRHRLEYPVSLDLDGRIAAAFDGITAVPTTLIVAPDGRLVYRQAGILDQATVRDIVRRYLNT